MNLTEPQIEADAAQRRDGAKTLDDVFGSQQWCCRCWLVHVTLVPELPDYLFQHIYNQNHDDQAEHYQQPEQKHHAEKHKGHCQD
jgi:hypothetical protein